MPDAPGISRRTAHDAASTWLALTASQRGAAHEAVGMPNQDAVAARQIQQDGLVAAVADGHGHSRHFRSARGSALAVEVACDVAENLAARLSGFESSAERVETEALRELVLAVTARWRVAVRDDLAAEPFTGAEEGARRAGDDALIAYGSTLLLAIACQKWLVLAQIGDGSIVGIQPDGRPLQPVPGDPALNGQQTTSLCGHRAEKEFRGAIVNTAATPLLGVLLATDGYGNAQAANPWDNAVSADLAGLIGDRSPEWLASQLPLWAGRCASADGSADDTTIALLIAPSAAALRRKASAPTVAVTGDPAVGHPAAPVRDLQGSRSALPSWRRRLVVIAAVLALIAVAVVLVVTRFSSTSTTTHAAKCGPPPATGRVVTGRATTACDLNADRPVVISMTGTGLPAGKRVALQADNSVFVLAGDRLWWRPVTGHRLRWVGLGAVPLGARQEMCYSVPSVIVTSTSAAKTASWTEVKVAAESPARIGPPRRVASNPCAERHIR